MPVGGRQRTAPGRRGGSRVRTRGRPKTCRPEGLGAGRQEGERGRVGDSFDAEADGYEADTSQRRGETKNFS